MTPPPERDRDQVGRPRSARPRDQAGRPLEPGAAGIDRVPDDLALDADQTLVLAQESLDADAPFTAHEVIEARWRTGPDDEKDLWQGLAQLAVALTHLQRDNPTGAESLLRRGADHLAAWSGDQPHAIDVAALTAWAEELADEIDRFGQPADGVQMPRLTGD